MALLGVGIVALLTVGRYLEAPAGTPRQADLIVALGGDTGQRVREAFRLYSEHYAGHILLTGIESGDAQTRPYYLNWRAAFLVAQGVPREMILFDPVSANSWDEAANTRRLMEARGWERVLVISDPPHMRRLQWTWSKAFAGSGRQFWLIAAQMEGWRADRWWLNEKSAHFVVMELIKLTYYKLAH